MVHLPPPHVGVHGKQGKGDRYRSAPACHPHKISAPTDGALPCGGVHADGGYLNIIDFYRANGFKPDAVELDQLKVTPDLSILRKELA
jgi:hypothetical protein